MVSLQAADSQSSACSAESTSEGAFELLAPEAGTYLLTARGALNEVSQLDVADRVELSLQEQTWERDFSSFGSVEGSRPGGPVSTQSDPVLVWLGPGDLRASLKLKLDDQGRFSLPLVPSGPCKIQVWTQAGKLDLVTFEVMPNKTTQVELP